MHRAFYDINRMSLKFFFACNDEHTTSDYQQLFQIQIICNTISVQEKKPRAFPLKTPDADSVL